MRSVRAPWILKRSRIWKKDGSFSFLVELTYRHWKEETRTVWSVNLNAWIFIFLFLSSDIRRIDNIDPKRRPVYPNALA